MPKTIAKKDGRGSGRILGVSQGTVRTWAADGKIPMHRYPANGYRLFKREELEKFLRLVARPINTTQPKHQ